MTVRELQAILSEMDGDLIVVCPHPEDYPFSPSPMIRVYDFNSNYWDDDGNLFPIKANTSFVIL